MSIIKFTKDHEWIKLDSEVATVSITDYTQKQLGDVVFVELPEIGQRGRRQGSRRRRVGQGRQ